MGKGEFEMNSAQRRMLREFFKEDGAKTKAETFKCDKCDFKTWANLKLIRHKQEVHAY